MTVTSGNQLVECQECHNLYHQDCHKPQVTDKDVNDPRLIWYCARCTRQMKKMVRLSHQFDACKCTRMSFTIYLSRCIIFNLDHFHFDKAGTFWNIQGDEIKILLVSFMNQKHVDLNLILATEQKSQCTELEGNLPILIMGTPINCGELKLFFNGILKVKTYYMPDQLWIGMEIQNKFTFLCVKWYIGIGDCPNNI